MRKACVVVLFLFVAASANAEVIRVAGSDIEVTSALPVNSFGTLDSSFLMINSYSATPFESTTTYTGSGTRRWGTSGIGEFVAPIELPTGTQIIGFEADVCDTDAARSTLVIFVEWDNATNAPMAFAINETGIAATPGCVTLSSDFSGAPLTVNNTARSYFLDFQTGVSNGATAFANARVAYKLQISPAPAVATFADVPTSHGFFKFVEALAAAGITGGCGGGNFCPNLPVTRGQMAVFLATALGLHWPN